MHFNDLVQIAAADMSELLMVMEDYVSLGCGNLREAPSIFKDVTNITPVNGEFSFFLN